MRPTKKKQGRNVLEFNPSRDDVEARLLKWIRGIAQSNEQLVHSLERLRNSYKAMLTGLPAKEPEELLWQVERALTDARKAKSLVLECSSPESEGA